MENGRSNIVAKIAEAEAQSSGEIRVHLSQRWLDGNPMERAMKLFRQYRMDKTSQRNAILLYVNLRKRKFALFGDIGIYQKLGQNYWNQLARELRQNLQGTHSERAIGFAIESLGKALHQHYPKNLL